MCSNVMVAMLLALVAVLCTHVVAVKTECNENFVSCLNNMKKGGDRVGFDCCDCAKDCWIEKKPFESSVCVLASEKGHRKHSNSKEECRDEADHEDEGNETKLSAVNKAFDYFDYVKKCSRKRSSRKLQQSCRTAPENPENPVVVQPPQPVVVQIDCVEAFFQCMLNADDFFCNQCLQVCDEEHAEICFENWPEAGN